MKIVILNGEPEAGSAFDGYVQEVAERATAGGHETTLVHLRTLAFEGCSGCWGCWVKTPGECVKRDDSETVCRAVIGSDLVVMASPLIMGFTSALLKRAMDQMIPLVHPYIEIEGGEMHHRARYARYPAMALLLDAGPGADAEDVELTRTIWARTARNLKSRLVQVAVAGRTPEEVADGLLAAA